MRMPRTILALASALASLDLAVAQDTTRVSVDSGGAEGNSNSSSSYSLRAVSADGNVVAFTSAATNLVAGDTNATADVFVHDRTTGLTERVSVDSAGVEGNSDSSGASLSADGNFVVFVSRASNFVAGDTNGYLDVFVHDRSTGITECMSVDSAGIPGNLSSGLVDASSISADGRFVAFTSLSSNLVAGDTNASADVFVRDRSGGTTVRVSVDSTGAQAKWGAHGASISAD